MNLTKIIERNQSAGMTGKNPQPLQSDLEVKQISVILPPEFLPYFQVKKDQTNFHKLTKSCYRIKTDYNVCH